MPVKWFSFGFLKCFGLFLKCSVHSQTARVQRLEVQYANISDRSSLHWSDWRFFSLCSDFASILFQDYLTVVLSWCLILMPFFLQNHKEHSLRVVFECAWSSLLNISCYSAFSFLISFTGRPDLADSWYEDFTTFRKLSITPTGFSERKYYPCKQLIHRQLLVALN